MAKSVIAISIVLILGVACFMRAGVFQDEITLWSDAVAKSPNKARSHNNLGRAYLEKGGRHREALPFILRALDLDPNYVDAHFNLAMTLYVMGMKADASREFGRIIELGPSTEQATFARAMLKTIHVVDR